MNIKYSRDIIGQRFGRFTVLEKVIINNRTKFKCLCDCGNIRYHDISTLINCKVMSCGCHSRDIRRKHGKSKTRLYRIWNGMIQRCYNSKRKSYKSYGERGIVICDEWKNDFESFEAWAYANGYTDDDKSLSIERINVNGNYEPNNCKWIHINEQAFNTRRTHLMHDGTCLSEYCRKNNISASCYKHRLERGYDYDTAISPINMNENKYVLAPDGSKNLSKWCKNNGYNYYDRNF